MVIYLGCWLPNHLLLPTRESSETGNLIFSYLALLQRGFTSQFGHPNCWWSLTPPFHPCLCFYKVEAIGGIVSVALSIESPRLGITQPLALWSPDFPHYILKRYSATIQLTLTFFISPRRRKELKEKTSWLEFYNSNYYLALASTFLKLKLYFRSEL